MTTGPSSLAGRSAIAGLITMLCVAMGASLSAHRRDELWQAARVGVEPDRVRLEISLTPGIQIAEAFIREIDDDGDLRLSEAEQQAYAERVLGVSLFGSTTRLRSAVAGRRSFSGRRPVAQRRGGDHARDGGRSAVLESRRAPALLFAMTARRPTTSLANALCPTAIASGSLGQERDFYQRQLTVAFELREGQPSSFNWAWLGLVCALPLVVAVCRRPGRSRRPGHRVSRVGVSLLDGLLLIAVLDLPADLAARPLVRVDVRVGVAGTDCLDELPKAPASIPLSGTEARTSAAVISPVTVPSIAGHAGLPPPPQRNAWTAPLTERCAKWMCAWIVVSPSSPS